KQPTGAVTGKGLDGVERLVYATDVGRYGLRAAAGISTAAVMGPVHSTLERSIAVALATLLCGIGLAVYSARGLVRPLRSLANTARAWGRGVAGPRADETLPGAFGTLAAEFNHMVSAREKSQALLLESQERYSQMLDGVDMIAVRVRFDGTLIYCNDALVRILGWTREELLGRGWIDRVISSEAGALVLRYKNGFDENRFQRSRDVEFRTRSGQTRLIRLNSSVVFDGSGQPESLSSIGEDITQQREVERAMEARRQAEAANLAKTNFLSRMSHELRTPLNAVIGFSRLLRDSAARKLSTTETHQLDLVVSAATQLNALIDDVLDIASIEGGRTSVDVREVDLFRLVEDALRMSDAAAVARGVRLLRPAAPHASLGIQTDPIRLRQIVLNLLSNGIKYNRDGGSVRIDIELVASLDATDGAAANHASLTDEASAGAVRITVHDSGAGMTPDQLANLFQPFNRLGREKGNVEGTGIGMVLSKQLTSLLGGTLAVSSQVGVGTSVQLTLPRVGALWAAGAKEGSREEPPPSAPLPAMDLDVAADNTADLQGAAQPHGRVLYIEDNQVNAVLVERLLSRWPDVQVSVAEDGTSGLALAAQQQPHLLLLDMHLPDMDGLAVLEALRASPGTRHIPVVALSANAMPDEVQATLDAGALAYWTKPIDFDSFLAGMHSLLTPAHSPVVQRTEATLGTD
ncbi:MAG: hypothetical protein JWP52_281, partial [Rhizobacter sp.]|nr:hypothetical protein [Rhizobacter sp.]